MVIFADDVEYFRAMNSPFKKYSGVNTNFPNPSSFFDEIFPEQKSINRMASLPVNHLWDHNSRKVPKELRKLYANFTEEEYQEFIRALQFVRYNKDDVIYQEGEEGQCMFYILNGKVEIFFKAPDIKIPTVILSQGDTFGEMGFVTKAKRRTTVTVLELSDLLILRTKNFTEWEKRKPHLVIKLLTNLFNVVSERFQKT